MRSHRENVKSAIVVSSQACCRSGLVLVALLLLVFWPTASAMAQSAAAPTAKPQTPSQPESQPATSQTDSGNKPQSLGDAARALNAQKDKPKSKHVYTSDDLSQIHGTISEVGNGSSGSRFSGSGNSGTAFAGDQSSVGRNEAYWRAQARAIKDQIAAVDQQIAQKKEEISKAGPASMDPTTGLTQNVIIIHDRNAELKALEGSKQNLERQLDNLADEGRRAGADPGWFR